MLVPEIFLPGTFMYGDVSCCRLLPREKIELRLGYLQRRNGGNDTSRFGKHRASESLTHELSQTFSR